MKKEKYDPTIISDHDISFFQKYASTLISRFMKEASCEQKEKAHRKDKLLTACDQLFKKRTMQTRDRVLQLTHELESYLFLLSRGSVKMASDRHFEAGADFFYHDMVSIESVCATFGDLGKSGLSGLLGEGYFDYNEKRRLLNARLTNSLCEKAKFFYEHEKRGSTITSPYIIFLSLGMLAYEWFEEKYGMALTDVLLGRGNPTIAYNSTTGEIRDAGYSHTETFRKSNGSEITSNLFLCPDFRCVSGILLATRCVEQYSSQNTFLYINPFATVSVDPILFGDIVYWKADSSGRYQPYQNGNLLQS